MEDVYNGIHSPVDYSDRTAIGSSVSPEDLVCQSDFNASANYQTYGNSGIINPIAGGDQVFTFSALPRILDFAAGAEEVRICAAENQITSVMKSKIANHPRYPSLVEAYIDCRKVGAPPEIASLLEEIRRENGVCKTNAVISSSCSFGADPELDEFMESYFEVLVKYKSDLTHPFDEATSFLRKTERRLRNLCDGILQRKCGSADEQTAGLSDEEMSDGEIEVQDASPRCQERDLKDKLLRKYSGYLSSLKQEFSKKKKKGKLPKDARQMLLEWWDIHYKWPYPTEADKVALAECTGLDQTQINNWFINQRKRHWKPSENMQFEVMDTLSAPIFYAAEG